MRARRMVIGVAGVATCVLALGALVLWLERVAVLESAAREWLAGRGLHDVSLEVEHADARRVVLRHVEVGSPATLGVDTIEVEFSPGQLAAGRIERVRLRGVRLRVGWSGEGFDLGALEPLRRAAAGPEAPSAGAGTLDLRALSFAALSVEDARVELSMPEGDASASLEGSLEPVGEAGADIRLRATLSHARGEASVTFAGRQRAAGVLEADFESTGGLRGLSRDGLQLGELAWALRGDGRFEHERLEVTLAECAQLRLAAIAIEGLLVPGPIDLCPGAAASGHAGLPGDAQGEWQVRIDSASVPFAGVLDQGETSLRVKGRLPGIALTITGVAAAASPRIELRARDGAVTVPLYEVSLRGLSLDAALEPGESWPRGRLAVAELVHARTPDAWPRLGGTLAFEPRVDVLTFDGRVRDADQLTRWRVRGEHAPGTGRGRLAFTLDPLTLGPAGPQPGDFVGDLAGATTFTAGRVDVEGALEWSPAATPQGRVAITLKGVGGSSAAVSYAGLAGRIELLGPFSPSTPGPQRLTIERATAGVLFERGVFDVQLHPDGRVELARMQWNVAEGVLTGRGEWDPLKATADLDLTLDAIELARLIDLAEVQGLQARGRVSGRIPLRYAAGALTIRAASIQSVAADGRAAAARGWVRYRPPGAAALAARSDGMANLMGALENFDYEALDVDLAGDTQGEVTLGLHLRGANPDYLGGKPVELHVNIDATLADLLNGAARAWRLPDAMGRARKRPAQR